VKSAGIFRHEEKGEAKCAASKRRGKWKPTPVATGCTLKNKRKKMHCAARTQAKSTEGVLLRRRAGGLVRMVPKARGSSFREVVHVDAE